MKWLLVCRVAGLAATPVSLANALGFDVGLGGESNYEYARQLLEKLRRAAPFLALERAEDPLLNRYVVDAGKRVGELARRHVSGLAESLSPGDSRLTASAIRACRADPFPLSTLGEARSFSIFWHHTPRQIAVNLWDGASAGALANRVLATREIGSPSDAFLLLLPPFSREDSRFRRLSRLLVDERTKAAFWGLEAARNPAR
jgi:hypothetical protein